MDMKKGFKKIAAVLMCAWNLYMPNTIQEEQDLFTQTQQVVPVVEEVIVEDFTDDFVDSSEQSRIKRRAIIKRIVSFVPSAIWAFLGLFGGWMKYPVMFILGFILLVLIGWLLLKNKPWASLLGIGIGSGLIYIDIQDADRILEEALLGVFLIIYFVIILYVSKKFKKKKKVEVIFENV